MTQVLPRSFLVENLDTTVVAETLFEDAGERPGQRLVVVAVDDANVCLASLRASSDDS